MRVLVSGAEGEAVGTRPIPVNPRSEKSSRLPDSSGNKIPAAAISSNRFGFCFAPPDSGGNLRRIPNQNPNQNRALECLWNGLSGSLGPSTGGT